MAYHLQTAAIWAALVVYYIISGIVGLAICYGLFWAGWGLAAWVVG